MALNSPYLIGRLVGQLDDRPLYAAVCDPPLPGYDVCRLVGWKSVDGEARPLYVRTACGVDTRGLGLFPTGRYLMRLVGQRAVDGDGRPLYVVVCCGGVGSSGSGSGSDVPPSDSLSASEGSGSSGSGSSEVGSSESPSLSFSGSSPAASSGSSGSGSSPAVSESPSGSLVPSGSSGSGSSPAASDSGSLPPSAGSGSSPASGSSGSGSETGVINSCCPNPIPLRLTVTLFDEGPGADPDNDCACLDGVTFFIDYDPVNSVWYGFGSTDCDPTNVITLVLACVDFGDGPAFRWCMECGDAPVGVAAMAACVQNVVTAATLADFTCDPFFGESGTFGTACCAVEGNMSFTVTE